MIHTILETLSWGMIAASSAVIAGVILDFDRDQIRNITLGSFILGCIRGYTGKTIVTLLFET